MAPWRLIEPEAIEQGKPQEFGVLGVTSGITARLGYDAIQPLEPSLTHPSRSALYGLCFIIDGRPYPHQHLDARQLPPIAIDPDLLLGSTQADNQARGARAVDHVDRFGAFLFVI